jgi:palmitoyltransferase
MQLSLYLIYDINSHNSNISIDLSITAPIYDRGPDSSCVLGSTICGYFDYDTWTLALTIWVMFQLSWSLFLLAVQLYQVAVAVTTNESANANRYAYMNTNLSDFASGGGIEGSDGPAVMSEAGHHHHHHSKTSNFCPCLQLVAGARALHKARNQRGVAMGNIFDHGCWNNCIEFWSDSPNSGKGTVNYYELYDLQQMKRQTFQQAMEV